MAKAQVIDRRSVLIREAAQYIGCSESTLREAIRAGNVPTLKLTGKRTYIPVSWLEEKLQCKIT